MAPEAIHGLFAILGASATMLLAAQLQALLNERDEYARQARRDAVWDARNRERR